MKKEIKLEFTFNKYFYEILFLKQLRYIHIYMYKIRKKFYELIFINNLCINKYTHQKI